MMMMVKMTPRKKKYKHKKDVPTMKEMDCPVCGSKLLRRCPYYVCANRECNTMFEHTASMEYGRSKGWYQ